MGMGDLSIAIEDESNMLNLWDFCHNPAGFLLDEKRSVIRTDFAWDAYEVRNLPYDQYYQPFPSTKYKADGDVLHSWISMSLRTQGDLALGVEGNYISGETESRYHKNEATNPGLLAIFSRTIAPLTSFGASLGYLEKEFEWSAQEGDYVDWEKTKNFRAQMGLGRELSPSVSLGAVLGYDWLKREEDYSSFQPLDHALLSKASYPSNVTDRKSSTSYALWLSGQTFVEIEGKLKLGLETIIRYERADFRPPSGGFGEDKKEDYYFSSLRFRGIYDLTPKLRAGVFFFDNEVFAGFYEPISNFLFFPPYQTIVRHWGAGCSYRFTKRLLAGAEYHFRDSSEPSLDNRVWGTKHESLNLGVEGQLTKSVTLRGGFIRAETNWNPNYYRSRHTWENVITSGFGYQPLRWNLTLELSYRYALKKFKQWFGDPNVESGRHSLLLSLKKTF
jgi:opacity protein-like surface antigen